MAMPILGEFPNGEEWAGMALAATGVLLATGIAVKWLTKKVEVDLV
jgi:drug/metabolite transporter (DMT)-like permease